MEWVPKKKVLKTNHSLETKIGSDKIPIILIQSAMRKNCPNTISLRKYKLKMTRFVMK